MNPTTDPEQLSQRVMDAKATFQALYKSEPEVITRAPGRAEIIGNHTDYNSGYALSCGITRSTLTLVSKRTDSKILIMSPGYADTPVEFDLNNLSKGPHGEWTNYIKGVINELIKKGNALGGMNILISSNVPSSGGVSSSAALELSVATAILKLFGISMNAVEKAAMCQHAENGDLVGIPCGFLDQASSGLAQKDNFVFLDFLPKADMPVSEIRQIPADLKRHNASFVVIVDKNVKRNLGSSGYPARRALCEKSVPIIAEMLGKPMTSLRDVTVAEYEQCKAKLAEMDDTMRKRVEHIVYENQRVLDAVEALKNDNIEEFGKILTASGKSALELYELDEKTPELTKLVTSGREIEGVLGMRNMGGGFSAIALALVHNDKLSSFENTLNAAYGPGLEFIPFELAQGASIIE